MFVVSRVAAHHFDPPGRDERQHGPAGFQHRVGRRWREHGLRIRSEGRSHGVRLRLGGVSTLRCESMGASSEYHFSEYLPEEPERRKENLQTSLAH
eukprot:7234417-Pyramimonas_sp.AAC.1